MIRQLLNTLYVQAQGAYLRLDHETLRVEVEGATQLQVPLHHLGAVVCLGNVLVSPFLIQRCGADGRSLTFLTAAGRFASRLEGPGSGNVLLRVAQYEAARRKERSAAIARSIVAAKVQNGRGLLLRAARESPDHDVRADHLRGAATALGSALARLAACSELDEIRGIEGESAHLYFRCLPHLVKRSPEDFPFAQRTRRPPRDPMNALLSFLYTLLAHDCVAAVQGVGMDHQVGFLHALRPGRPALALDLAEEFRSPVADRLALALVNRREIGASDFEHRPGGAVLLSESGRRKVIAGYQKRKQDEVNHPFLQSAVPIGLLPHVQARLLARHLRGGLDHYVPMVFR